MHRLAGRTHHITITIAHTTTTTRSITTTQQMGSTITMATARGMLYLTQTAWSISMTTTAIAKGTHQTHMEDKKLRKKALVERPAMTHQEIADYFGVSRAAVAQIETNALRKLKRKVEARGFVFEDFFGDEWDIS